MRILILSDIHDKIDIARRIIDSVPHDRRIFQGDFFDDFPTGPIAAKKTAIFVREMLRDSDTDVLLGNHDLSYGWSDACREHRCSGFTRAKHAAINAIIPWDDWCKFKLHLWIPGPRRPWLLTHAGFDNHFVKDGCDLIDTVDGRCDFALRSLHSPIPCERGRGHTILGVGQDRSGRQYRGGILWCDWDSLSLPPGADQLVGHTPARNPRVEEYPDAIGVCIDTHMRHYAVLEDGRLSVDEVDSLPIHP